MRPEALSKELFPPRPSVSVVVCSHNGETRMADVLGHLVRQRVDPSAQWEVLVVDNASTDDTAGAAARAWPASGPAPLRVVAERRPGLSFARWRAFQEAQHDVVSFVDDDNLVAQDWVETVTSVFRRRSDVGACGGRGRPALIVDPPSWFPEFERSYAVGPQAREAGDVTESPGHLYGAGLSIRTEAARQLLAAGFEPLLSGRRGKALTAGEDTEWCLALRLAGWRLWYESNLAFEHVLSEERLSWTHLRRLHRGFGAASVGHDPYYHVFAGSALNGFRRRWDYQCAAAAKDLSLAAWRLFRRLSGPLVGSRDVLRLDYLAGRLAGLFRARSTYAEAFAKIEGLRSRVGSSAPVGGPVRTISDPLG